MTDPSHFPQSNQRHLLGIAIRSTNGATLSVCWLTHPASPDVFVCG